MSDNNRENEQCVWMIKPCFFSLCFMLKKPQKNTENFAVKQRNKNGKSSCFFVGALI